MYIRSQSRNDRIQRDIYNCVCCTEETVRHIRPDQLTAVSKIGDIEGHKCKYCKWNRSQHEIRTSLPPFCMCTVYDQSHSCISQCINKFCYQHHSSGCCRSNPKYICIKNHQVRCHGAEHQIASQIPDTISNSFSPFSHKFTFTFTSSSSQLLFSQSPVLLCSVP